MKSFMKTTVLILIAITMIISSASCGGNQGNGDHTTATTPSTTAPSEEKKLQIATGENSDYIIVTPFNDEEGFHAKLGSKISVAILKECGAVVRQSNDGTFPADREIVIGTTNRYRPEKRLDVHEYLFVVEGQSVIITGGSREALEKAVDIFIRDYINADEKKVLSISEKLNFKGEFNKSEIESLIAKREETEAKTIRFASFNIQSGKMENRQYERLAKDIVDSGAEIVGLQEVDRFTNRNPKDTVKLLSELTGYKYYDSARRVR